MARLSLMLRTQWRGAANFGHVVWPVILPPSPTPRREWAATNPPPRRSGPLSRLIGNVAAHGVIHLFVHPTQDRPSEITPRRERLQPAAG